VNVGSEPFVFLAVFFGNAGHDYASIERDGFAVRVLADGDGYRVN
jgi:oxalate decarboxylase/phosphoglucose isomerase-like protein (cupin superfamily)